MAHHVPHFLFPGRVQRNKTLQLTEEEPTNPGQE